MSAFILYFLSWVFFPPFKGFIFINFFICPFICAPINIFNFIYNWIESVKLEDFIKIKENFGTPTPIVLQPYRGVEFIIKEN